jgi:hypothetical protein
MTPPAAGRAACSTSILMRGTTSLAFAILSFTSACAIDLRADDDAPGDDTTQPPPANATAQGVYQVRSVFDITAAAVLPEPAYQVVETLHDFSTAPAHTLIDLADAAGVPAVSELRAALPDSLESRLEGWIDDQIATVKIDGVPVTQVAGELAALAETSLTQFAVESTLDVQGARATHRLSKLDFTPAGLDAKLALDGLPDDIIAAQPTAACAHGALSLGDHRFGLPYGRYAWQALEAVVTAQYGAGVRDLLGAAVNCPAIATAIANKCLLGVCVGHRTELLEICEAGLDEVVGIARAKVEAQRFDAIHLAAGTAALAGVTADGTAARLERGTWTAEIDASQGLRPVPATFAGAR